QRLIFPADRMERGILRPPFRIQRGSFALVGRICNPSELGDGLQIRPTEKRALGPALAVEPGRCACMATGASQPTGRIVALGTGAHDALVALGDFALFSARALGWMVRRRPSPGTLLLSLYAVGVRSVPVIAVTGTFLGMVLAVQSYHQF